MDFDNEILIHLYWVGIPIIWIDTPVKYHSEGTSHFMPFKDNILISIMHSRLFLQMPFKKFISHTNKLHQNE